MFGQYFGNYLIEKNKISQTEFEDVMMQQQISRLKLGFIAVAEKLLTTKQAEEINDIQKKLDRRFGDIAVEKGYLLTEEVTYLLNMQGSSYLKFVQALTENNILSIEEIENCLEDFKKDNEFSDSDLDALKTGDIDRIISVFVDVDIPLTGECISLALRNVVRFINNNIRLKKAYTVKEYSFGNIAYQQVIGDHQIFCGIAGNENALLSIASPFAKETFQKLDEDAFDSVCEFINCTNGLYASKLSLEDIQIDMTPPLYDTGKTLVSNGEIYVVPIIIEGEQADLLVVVNNQFGIH
ncbi:MAG: hypothetical protein K0S76_2219 [Herbinix sp.]|jgi:hypothetical protein|nr:hypothetical protein [Herbinix sp.]